MSHYQIQCTALLVTYQQTAAHQHSENTQDERHVGKELYGDPPFRRGHGGKVADEGHDLGRIELQQF